jgi:hypothetical protein
MGEILVPQPPAKAINAATPGAGTDWNAIVLVKLASPPTDRRRENRRDMELLTDPPKSGFVKLKLPKEIT